MTLHAAVVQQNVPYIVQTPIVQSSNNLPLIIALIGTSMAALALTINFFIQRSALNELANKKCGCAPTQSERDEGLCLIDYLVSLSARTNARKSDCKNSKNCDWILPTITTTAKVNPNSTIYGDLEISMLIFDKSNHFLKKAPFCTTNLFGKDMSTAGGNSNEFLLLNRVKEERKTLRKNYKQDEDRADESVSQETVDAELRMADRVKNHADARKNDCECRDEEFSIFAAKLATAKEASSEFLTSTHSGTVNILCYIAQLKEKYGFKIDPVFNFFRADKAEVPLLVPIGRRITEADIKSLITFNLKEIKGNGEASQLADLHSCTNKFHNSGLPKTLFPGSLEYKIHIDLISEITEAPHAQKILHVLKKPTSEIFKEVNAVQKAQMEIYLL